MDADRSLIIGQIISRAWTDRRFQHDLFRDSADTLRRRVGIAIPSGISIRTLQNGRRLLHLVVGATTHAIPNSPLTELRRYAERYTDPRLEPLNWCARDQTMLARLVSAPRKLLSRWRIRIPRDLQIRVFVDSASLIHIPLPAPPRSATARRTIARIIEKHGAPATLKYVRLTGVSDLRVLVDCQWSTGP